MIRHPSRITALRLAALLLLALIQVIPPITTNRPVFDILAVLDITGSMNVRDRQIGQTTVGRIEFEKQGLRQLLAQLPCGSRLGVAVFVEAQPFLLFEPVETCQNFSALDAEITAINWRMGWDSESHIAEALLASMHLATSLHADLIFCTDGQETPPLDWSAPVNFTAVRNTAHGFIAGIGGYSLVAIPKFDARGREIGVFRPGDVPTEHGGMFSGHEHLSAVDETHLRKLAVQTGLGYIHPEDVDGFLQHFSARRTLPTATDIRFLPAILALALLALAWVPEKEDRGRPSFF